MGQSRRCPFCGGGGKRVSEWAYLAAGETRLSTLVQAIRCKWCRGTGRAAEKKRNTT